MSDALDGMKARLDAAGDEMDRLTAGSPGQNWRWSIPANPQCDTDLILSAPIPDMARLIKAVDDLLYVADNKAADNVVGRWWAEVIRGTIKNALGGE